VAQLQRFNFNYGGYHPFIVALEVDCLYG